MLAAMPLTPTTAPTGEEPRSRTGDDACPGALRLHRADDGFLARVRLPGGLLTAQQAAELAQAAEALGDGALDLTSRGNVQLRGLDSACGGELADRLRSVGLLPSDTHERVRNVALSPLSGLDGAGCADVTDWVRELDGLLCATPEAAGLSGRFLFAVDDGRGDVASLGADVTLIAEPAGRAVVRVATTRPTSPGPADAIGRATGPHPAGPDSAPGAGHPARPAAVALRVPAQQAPRAALLTALTFLAAVRDSGAKAWRVWELPAQHGLTEHALGAALARAGIPAEPVAAPAAGAAHPATDGAAPAPPLAPGDAAPAPGLVPAPHGAGTALSVTAPLGRLSLVQWRLLVSAARAGQGTVRMTPWRGVVVPGLPTQRAGHWLDTLAEAGFITDAGSAWYGAGACTGRPGCAKSLADVRADAATVLTAAARPTAGRPQAGGPPLGDGARDAPDGPPAQHAPRSAPADQPPAGRRRPRPLPVYWSGCERRCGHPQGRWVDVLAGADGYRVTVVGTERTAARPPGAEQRLGAEDRTADPGVEAPLPAAPAAPAPVGPAGRAEAARPIGLAELAHVVPAARAVP